MKLHPLTRYLYQSGTANVPAMPRNHLILLITDPFTGPENAIFALSLTHLLGTFYISAIGRGILEHFDQHHRKRLKAYLARANFNANQRTKP